MDEIGPGRLVLGIWSAAFWISFLSFTGSSRLRFLGVLIVGFVLARLGWAVLYWRVLALDGMDALEPLLTHGGFSVLLLPIGPFCFVPLRCARAQRVAYLGASFRALAVLLVLARLGCWVAGCCGARVSLPYPLPVYDAVASLYLFLLLCRTGDRLSPSVFLSCFGGIRLLSESVRVTPPLGEPLVAPDWIAAAWLLTGCLWFLGLRIQSRMLTGRAVLPHS